MNVALSNNLFMAGLQLLAWLFLRPAAWQRFVVTLDPALPPHFCLAELRISHWRNRELQKLVLAGYLFAPLLLVGGVLLILGGLGRLHQATLVFMLCGYGLACLFGLAVGAGVGAVLAVIAPLAFALAWSGSHIILVDLAWSSRLGILFGLISALAMHVTGNVTDHATSRSLIQQTGSFVIGLLVSGAVTATILGIAYASFQIRTSGFLPDSGLGLVSAIVPGLIVGLAVAGRSGDWRRGALAGCLLFVLAWWTYGNPGGEYGDAVGGDLLLWIYTGSATSITFGLFALAYILVNRIASP